MAKKEEKVIEEVAQETTVQVDESKFESAGDETVMKVDLNKPPAQKEDKTEIVDVKKVEAPQEEMVQPEGEAEEVAVLEEVTEKEAEEVEEVIAEAEATGKPLPGNIQKLVDFMEETGGDINDYVKLNKDYNSLDDNALLKEFYTQTKPHLDTEEINFLMEDEFSFDEDVDDEREIRKKKIALKEQVANAKSHLDGQKSKYYEEIKMGSKLPDEAQKAMDFFNRYNKESEVTKKTVKKNTDVFTQKTEQVFNDKFKGFEYDVGDKKYRFNVNNANEVKNTQSDINNFTKKFLDKNNIMSDAKGYHKSLFTANNPDAIANHFYQQGKSDALKDSVSKAKNISMDPRQSMPENTNTSGPKVRVLTDDTPTYGFKRKTNK